MTVLATIGAKALYLLFIWLLSAAGAAWVAERKGYSERVGLTFGLILSVVGLVIVLLLPSRPGSAWKGEGPLPKRKAPPVDAEGPMPDAGAAAAERRELTGDTHNRLAAREELLGGGEPQLGAGLGQAALAGLVGHRGRHRGATSRLNTDGMM